MRLRYRVNQHSKFSAGIDSLDSRTHRAFHPFTQRTYSAELRCDH